MDRDFQQIQWDDLLRQDLRDILRVALREDLGKEGDWTSQALLPAELPGEAEVVAREGGVIAGLAGAETILEAVDPQLGWREETADGQQVRSGQCIARVRGPARSVLAAERLLLNFLGRLSGIATLTRRFVEAAGGTKARIYDTRKTVPGWRRLEKYAVRCGGGNNHRIGLFDAVLVKDNHLAVGATPQGRGPAGYSPAEAVRKIRRHLETEQSEVAGRPMILEVEVDSLEQLEGVLKAEPDIVLLDNMSPAELRQAVGRRDAVAPEVQLEASGGVDLETVQAIAATGVERISVGALTHSAPWLDLALEWLTGDDGGRRHAI